MTNEERDLIQNFIRRVGGAPAGGFGSVPATTNLPPVDREADALIAEQFQRFPEARYRITQLAFIQEHMLAEASNRINQLQAELDAARAQAQQAQQARPSPWGAAAQHAPQPQQSRGFFGGLFGGGQPAPPPQPQYAQPGYPPPQYAQPQYAPGYQPGMFQPRGTGFLGSALTTAAGVAGGMVVGNWLMDKFSGHGSAASGFGAPTSASPGFLPPEPPASPWAGSPAADPYETGGMAKDTSWAQPPQDSGWQQASSDQGGWQDASPADGGWSDASSDDESA